MSMASDAGHNAPVVLDVARLAPGFADPVHDAQAIFRVVLDAMSHPGRICTLTEPLAAPPPTPLGEAAAAIALALCDLDTVLWLDAALAPAADYLRFHCGSPLAAQPSAAQFAFIGDGTAMPPLDAFALGSDEYPDRSASLVIAVTRLQTGDGLTLSGPGIAEFASLVVDGVPARFWSEREALAELAPRGLDIIFTCGPRLAALPRTTRVTR